MAKSDQTAKTRVFFNKDDSLAVPDLIAHQKDSWREFVETGLSEIFAELNPIEDYTGQKLALEFKDYHFDEPKHSERDAKENNLTFDAPLYANVELVSWNLWESFPKTSPRRSDADLLELTHQMLAGSKVPRKLRVPLVAALEGAWTDLLQQCVGHTRGRTDSKQNP